MKKRNVLFFSIAVFHFSCGASPATDNDIIDWHRLEKEYALPKDSLKLKAVHFLKENMSDLTSLKIKFYNKEGNEVNFDWQKFKSDSALQIYLEENNLHFETYSVPDVSVVSTEKIKQTVEFAFNDWQKYEWNKNLSFDNFLNYLLPYKVFDEYPDNWRIDLKKRYDSLFLKYVADSKIDYLKSYFGNVNELYYLFVMSKMEDLFSYSPNPSYLSSRPGFNEMSSLKNGDCFGESYLACYYLRSIGIPATVDYIPAWGSRNGRHMGVVFVDENNNIKTPSGREMSGAAKVFRITFRKNAVWKDSIAPFVDTSIFILNGLKDNHWYDVTREHSTTRNLTLATPTSLHVRWGYICVFNYGEWVPVFWGKSNNKSTLTYNNMAYPMLYRMAIPDMQGFKVVGPIYLVDSTGKVNIVSPDFKNTINLSLNKLNTGAESWVKKGNQYELFVLDGNGDQRLISIAECKQDSLINFSNVPGTSLYRLIEKGDTRELSRPFTYEYGKQNWW